MPPKPVDAARPVSSCRANTPECYNCNGGFRFCSRCVAPPRQPTYRIGKILKVQVPIYCNLPMPAQRVLAPPGFDSIVAASQAFRAEPKRFDLALTDETMRDLTATELTREVRRLRPEIPLIPMSGYGGAQLSNAAATVSWRIRGRRIAALRRRATARGTEDLPLRVRYYRSVFQLLGHTR